MPILPSVKPADATGEVKETFDKVEEAYGGVVPELLGVAALWEEVTRFAVGARLHRDR